jgi:hypothetical protein
MTSIGPVDNVKAKIWRYMDFTKFVSMLENEGLFFCRADLFDDPFEGSNSKVNANFQPETVYKDSRPAFIEIVKRSRQDLSHWLQWQRQWTMLNCWHMSECESAAMWKLYSKSNEAICIQSTFESLERCLNLKAQVGVVQYINYETEEIPEGNILYPLLYKRKSFAHEREVRAIISDPPLAKGGWQYDEKPTKNGVWIPVELKKLIEAVYVAPTSQLWFRELTEQVAARYRFDKSVHRSSLDDDPVY